MSRLATSFVLGYHGCDREVAEKAVAGDFEILQSDRDYDWLGPGAYFWEADPRRALEWADWKVRGGHYREAAVVGAVIDLRNCLDLVNRDDLVFVTQAHASFIELQATAGLPMPENRNVPGDPNEDRSLRYLDCAVFRHLHAMIEAKPAEERVVESFDTVRGTFMEGGDLYTGSGLKQRSHVQIAVRSGECIKGFFHPRPSLAG